jgi:hypothetical protein
MEIFSKAEEMVRREAWREDSLPETWLSSNTEVTVGPKSFRENADQDRESPRWEPPISSLMSDTNDEDPGSLPFSSYYEEESGTWSIRQTHTGKSKLRRLKKVILLLALDLIIPRTRYQRLAQSQRSSRESASTRFNAN